MAGEDEKATAPIGTGVPVPNDTAIQEKAIANEKADGDVVVPLGEANPDAEQVRFRLVRPLSEKKKI